MVRLDNEKGAITITDEVFANLAGGRRHELLWRQGHGRARQGRACSSLRRESMSRGVAARLGEDGSVSLELHIAVDHGVNLMALCSSIMNEVSYKVSMATGVPVKRRGRIC